MSSTAVSAGQIAPPVEEEPRGRRGLWLALLLLLGVGGAAGWYFMQGPGAQAVIVDTKPAAPKARPVVATPANPPSSAPALSEGIPRDELVGGKLPVEVNGDKSAPDDPGVEPAVGSDTLGAASGEPAEPVSTPKPRAKPQVKPNARGVPKSRAPKKGRASKPAAPSTAPAPAAEAQPPPPASQPKAGKAPPTGSPLDLSNPYR